MLTCPMCKQALPEPAPTCPRCAADLTLLVDFVSHRQAGLAQAEALARQGKLAEAVWAYLEVLEVDPDNPTARRQVGQMATAVRQFDKTAPGRRWLQRLRRQTRWRHWLYSWQVNAGRAFWLGVGAFLLLVILSFVLGYHFGYRADR